MFKSPKKLLAGAGALAALGLGGSAIADAASTSPTTTTTAPTAPGPGGSGVRPGFPAPGTAAHEGAEKAVTGAPAAKAQAAAVKSLGGGTAGAVTTNFTGNGYEVTVTKSDGTKVEVHLDNSFKVMQVPGRGGPGGPGGRSGRPPAGAGAGAAGAPPAGAPSAGAPPSGY